MIEYSVDEKHGMYLFKLVDTCSCKLEQKIAKNVSPVMMNGNRHKNLAWTEAMVWNAVFDACHDSNAYYDKGDNMWKMGDEPSLFDVQEKARIENERAENCKRLIEEHGERGVRFGAMKEWLQGRYGFKEGAFLAARIAKVHRKNTDPCKDNERIALEGVDSIDEYIKKKDSGCCGCAEYVFEFEDYDSGKIKRFHYGFNYGH